MGRKVGKIILLDGILNKYYRLVLVKTVTSYYSSPLLPIPNRLEAISGGNAMKKQKVRDKFIVTVGSLDQEGRGVSRREGKGCLY